MSAVSFVFNLIDKMSAPASKIAKAVGETGAAAKKSEKAFDPLPGKLGKVQAALKEAYGDKTAAMFGRFATGNQNASDKAKVAEKGFELLKGGAGAAAGALATAAAAAAAAAAVIGAAGIGLAAVGANYALEMFQFKQDTAFAWKYSLGSAGQAGTTLAYAEKIANTLGTSVKGVSAQLGKLFNKGLGSREAEMVVQMAADLKAATGQEADVGPIADAILALKNRAQPLTIEMLAPLTNLGPGAQEKVFGALAKTLNIKATTVEQQKREVLGRIGELKGQRGMDAIAAAFLATTEQKKAGEGAKLFQDTTVTGSIDKIKARVEGLFAKLKTGGVGTTLIDAMQKIAAALDYTQPGGKKLLATLDKLAGVAAKLFAKIDIGAAVDGFATLVDMVDGAIGPITAFAEAFGESFSDAVGPLGELFDTLTGGESSSADFESVMKDVGKALGTVAGYAVTVTGAIAMVIAVLVGAATAVMGAGVAVGAAVIDGMSNGIDGAKSKLVERLKALASLLPAAVRKVLDIQSPSRVFAQIGRHTIQGFSQGIEQEEPRAREVTLSALSPKALTSGQAGKGGGGRAGAGGSYTVNVTNNINGAKDADDVRRAADEGTMRAAAAIFEALALEAGAVGAGG